MPLMEEIGINSHAISLKELGEIDDIYVRKMKVRQFRETGSRRRSGAWVAYGNEVKILKILSATER
ncbi:MAG: hypothetical protein IKH16_12575 [Selenomonadaceae bacterium]|nr:hypothetical protein [Selenomonadaceae bacterium]